MLRLLVSMETVDDNNDMSYYQLEVDPGELAKTQKGIKELGLFLGAHGVQQAKRVENLPEEVEEALWEVGWDTNYIVTDQDYPGKDGYVNVIIYAEGSIIFEYVPDGVRSESQSIEIANLLAEIGV